MSITSYSARVALLVAQLSPAWVLAGQNLALQAEFDMASAIRDEICEGMAAANTLDAKQAHADLYTQVTDMLGDYSRYRAA